jgi:hypothetical protein
VGLVVRKTIGCNVTLLDKRRGFAFHDVMKRIVPRAVLTAAVVGLINLFLGIFPVSAISADDQAARDTALHWLALLDAHQYGQAFDAQPPRIQTGSIRENFIKWMQGRRTPLGGAHSRSFLKVVHTHKLAGAPDGDYQQIGFKTSFERKAEAVEAVVVTRETGHWQVSGYRIY